MKPTSKELLEEISKNCSNQITFYTYNKNVLKRYNENVLIDVVSTLYLGQFKSRVFSVK